jgi:hypothetical protein
VELHYIVCRFERVLQVELESVTLQGSSFSYWSPVLSAPFAPGSQIAFATNRWFVPVTNKLDIARMPSTGGMPTRVTSNNGSNQAPAWNPANPFRIAYRNDPNLEVDNYDIFTANSIDGTNESRVTFFDPRIDRQPAWSPLREKLAYAGDVDPTSAERYQVFTVNPDGTGSVDVTNSTEDDNQPDWSTGHLNVLISAAPRSASASPPEHKPLPSATPTGRRGRRRLPPEHCHADPSRVERTRAAPASPLAGTAVQSRKPAGAYSNPKMLRVER